MINSWMLNLQVIDEVVFCLETGKWISFDEIVRKCSLSESKLDLILNLRQHDLVQQDFEKNVFCINPEIKGLINRINEIPSKEKSNKTKKIKCKDTPILIDSKSKFRISDMTVNLASISLIIIIGFYLAACTIAPIVNLNNQAFRMIFTIVGGIPSILFYSKIQTKK